MRVFALGFVMMLGVSSAAAQCGGCTANEICCMDTEGYECCIFAETACMQQKGTYPARCCPKWTVGCETGSVGCCDPARPWQRELTPNPQVNARNPLMSSFVQEGVVAEGVNSRQATNSTAKMYAIFMSGINEELRVLQVSPNGDVKKEAITGPVKTWFGSLYGMATRIFTFDPKRMSFHFVDESPNRTHHIQLYSVNALTGESTMKEVKSESGFPISMEWHQEQDRLFFVTHQSLERTFSVYSIDVDTAEVQQVGTYSTGSGESDASFYSGYYTGLSLDARSSLRLGYQMYDANMSGPGLGVTQMSSGSTKWNPLSSPAGSYFLWSLDRIPNTDTYMSLAPAASGDHSFQLYEWNMTSSPTLLTSWSNAHAPSSSEIGTLGYIDTACNSGTFAAMVLEKGSTGVNHQWAVATYDIATKQATINTLNPAFLVAEGASVSAFGIGN